MMSMMLGQGARASGALAHALRGCAAVGKQQWAAPAAAAPVVAGATSTVFMSSSSSSSTPAKAYDVGDSTNIKWHEGRVDRQTREAALGQKGVVIWLTGLSGSGKSTLAFTLEHALANRGKTSYVLDGDNVRHGLNSNLGFTAEDRKENIRRIGEVSKLFAEAGMITIVSFISPYRGDRDAVRARLEKNDFVEVYMKIPLSVCESRDPKGLYKAARAGKIKGFTGIDDPYEEPENAEIVVEVSKEDGVLQAPEKMAEELITFLDERGYLKA